MLTQPALRLARSSRIKQGRDFLRLKTQGRRLVCGCLIMNWLSGHAATPRRLGVITSRKVGPAVDRSRARRLLREAWRKNQHSLAPALELVLVARPSIAHKKLAEVERDFRAALQRAGLLKINEPRPTSDRT